MQPASSSWRAFWLVLIARQPRLLLLEVGASLGRRGVGALTALAAARRLEHDPFMTLIKVDGQLLLSRACQSSWSPRP